MGQLSMTGLFENLAFVAPLLMLLLMPAGFIGSAWVTNRVFIFLGRDQEDVKTVDQVGTFLLLTALFASYVYVVCALFVE